MPDDGRFFDSWERFMEIENSLSGEELRSWAESLTLEQILITSTDDGVAPGWTVAHTLAYEGVLPEKFFTDDILLLSDDPRGNGWTVACSMASQGRLPKRLAVPEILDVKNLFGTILAHTAAVGCAQNDRWDNLHPEILRSILRHDDNDGIQALAREIHMLSNQDLPAALVKMPAETICILLDLPEIETDRLASAFRDELTRRSTEAAHEEISFGNADFQNGGADDLYCLSVFKDGEGSVSCDRS